MGKKPKYDLKEAKIYKTLKDAHNMASEVRSLLLFLGGNPNLPSQIPPLCCWKLPQPRLDQQDPLLTGLAAVPTGEVQGRPEEAAQARHGHEGVAAHEPRAEHEPARQCCKLRVIPQLPRVGIPLGILC